MKKKIHISKEDAERFTEGLGQIAAGGYKLILVAMKQGVPEALGYEDVRGWVNQRLGGYIRYSVRERIKIVDELLDNGETQRDIAKALGVQESTIGLDKATSGKHPIKKYPPRTTKKDIETEPKPADPDHLAERGLEILVWDKVKDRFLPFWHELLSTLEPDEAEVLSYVIWKNAPYELTNI